MLCQEAVEQLSKRRSVYLGHPAIDSWAEEVDHHVEGCRSCRTMLRALIWRKLFVRPGLLHFARTISTSRVLERRARPYIRAEASNDEICAVAEEDPITRIVMSLIVLAIKCGASDVRLREVDEQYVASLGSAFANGASHITTAEMYEAVAIYGTLFSQADSQRRCVLVQFHIGEECQEQVKLPLFVRKAIMARIKSMAEMKVCIEGVEQKGAIPVRYENVDFDIAVVASPDQNGEALSLSIVRRIPLVA